MLTSKPTAQTTSTAQTAQGTEINRQKDYQIAWVATLLFFIAFYALIVPLPRYLGSIGLSDWQVGLVLGANAIAAILARPVSGLLTDRFGYKPMLLGGALALFIGATGILLTTQVMILFLLRIFQALGYVIFTTAGNALVGILATPAERSTKVAYFGLAANFAMTMTPGAIDLLLPTIGLASAFIIAGVMALCAGGLTRLLAYSQSTTAAHIPGLQLPQLWQFPQRLWLSMLVSTLFGVGFGAYFQFFAVLLQRRTITPAAAVFAAYGIGIIVTRLAFGRYLDRMGFGLVLTAAAIIMLVGLLLAAVGHSLWVLIGAALLIAAGGGLFHPMLISHHVALLPEATGRAVASFYFGFDLGIGIGAWILGAILDWWGLTSLYLAAAAITLSTLLLVPSLVWQRRQLQIP